VHYIVMKVMFEQARSLPGTSSLDLPRAHGACSLNKRAV